MKILTIIGARPQFIKAAPLSAELRKKHAEVLVHTGQHYDANMSQIFFDELGIPAPDIHLGVGGGSHAAQTSSMMMGIEDAVLDVKPDMVLVYGDTNSTIAGALVASKLCIPIVHVEAGLRSYDRSMPEEVNRVVTDHLSSVLLAPSEAAVANLLAEGISNGVHSVGDIMADSVRIFSKRAQEQSTILDRLMLSPNDYVLGTIHRASNTDSIENLVSIFKGLSSSDHKVVIPLHPRTRKVLDANRILVSDNVRFVDPVGYLDMLQLIKDSMGVITDSGGLQKEAYYMGVRCLTMRENTEWVETLDFGWNELVGVNSGCISTGISRLSNAITAERPELYGDGYSAIKMVNKMEGFMASRLS